MGQANLNKQLPSSFILFNLCFGRSRAKNVPLLEGLILYTLQRIRHVQNHSKLQNMFRHTFLIFQRVVLIIFMAAEHTSIHGTTALREWHADKNCVCVLL